MSSDSKTHQRHHRGTLATKFPGEKVEIFGGSGGGWAKGIQWTHQDERYLTEIHSSKPEMFSVANPERRQGKRYMYHWETNNQMHLNSSQDTQQPSIIPM